MKLYPGEKLYIYYDVWARGGERVVKKGGGSLGVSQVSVFKGKLENSYY